MKRNFKNYDDFEKYLEEQDKWIYEWSLPEHYLFAYMLEKSIKYKAGKVVEYIYMVNSGNIFTNDISVYHKKGEQPHEIWSGHVNSPDEYQAVMVVVNKFIEEYKNNLGAI